ncbi:MAG: hypothetical protein IJV77_01585, partial [Clostridia bacterium]|nr:hypothetical protein [Clostridia bacterium]
MDFVFQQAESIRFAKGKAKKAEYADVSCFIKKPACNAKKTDYLHKDKIMDTVQEFARLARRLRQKQQRADDSQQLVIEQDIAMHKQECIKKVRSLCTSQHVVWLVVKELDKQIKDDKKDTNAQQDKNVSIKSYLFEALFEKQNTTANEMVVCDDNENCYLTRDPDGKILLYGIKYSKTCSKK